ncbi:hypothetical protein CK203_050453 [Vitis vinifera]|uniref:Amine oxidase domain-containing protein n=1 Tax=Vitis vinifera TaxID=29760 RepID=A0A438H1U2_VITVI|nr:hypothetical protein CK203_050453 [Vitis vinifera]
METCGLLSIKGHSGNVCDPARTGLKKREQSRIITMASPVSRVAVVGSGISGAVCASLLARNGVSVTLFESARGPGGRMSYRKEWEARGLVAEWKENFASFDCISRKFIDFEKEGLSKKYVGVPVMNSICRALCHEPGVESKFGVGVGSLEWFDEKNLWSLTGLDGQNLGNFEGVVASDKNIFSKRFTDVTGRPPPLGCLTSGSLHLSVLYPTGGLCQWIHSIDELSN